MTAFDPYVDGRRFRSFSRAFIRQTKGRWAGQPLDVEPWQASFVDELLRRDPLTNRRVYTEALLGIPRKNGKSTLSAAIALYFLVVEGTLRDPGAEIYAAAGSKDQARIVFEQTKAFVNASPRLRNLCDVQRDRILLKETGAIFRVLSSDAPRQHGLNPSLVIIDELHAHKDGDLYEALTTGDLAREEPLTVTITTAGVDIEGSILGEVFTRCAGPNFKYDREAAKILPSDDKPADMLFEWYAVADEDIDDPEAWERANPASWVTLERLKAKAPPRTKQSSWERLHLNRWTAAEEAWLPPGAWDACEGDAEFEEGEEVYLGVDMGRKRDTAALVLAAGTTRTATVTKVVDDEEVEVEVQQRPVKAMVWGVWADKSKPAPKAHELVDEKVDFSLVEDAIREACRLYDVREVAYDPWRFDKSAETLEDEGIPMVEYPQTNERMCPASQGLYDDVIEKLIVHDHDPVFAAHLDAAVARDVTRDTWRLDKKKTKAASDAAFALAIANDRAKANEGGGFSIRFFDEDDD